MPEKSTREQELEAALRQAVAALWNLEYCCDGDFFGDSHDEDCEIGQALAAAAALGIKPEATHD